MTEPLNPTAEPLGALSGIPAEVASRTLSLAALAQGTPGLSPAFAGFMAEAASVCLHEEGHGLAVPLVVEGAFAETCTVHRQEVDARMRFTHADLQVATENGAYGVAILAVRELTGLTVVRRSRKGTGFDFWLSREGDFLFRAAARLEVSGIRRGPRNLVESRLKRKKEQTRRSDGQLPALVAVVEFGTPLLNLEER